MSIKSNVTIRSNVYVNKTKSQEDKDFLKHVRGYDAISKISYCLRTEIQQNEFTYGGEHICSNDISGDKVRGTVKENGKSLFITKCEQKECSKYAWCSKWLDFRKIERNSENVKFDEDQYIPPDFSLLRYLDAADKIVYFKTIETSQKTYAPPDIIIKPVIALVTETVTETVAETVTEIATETITEIVTKINESADIGNVKIKSETELPLLMKMPLVTKPDEPISREIEYKRIESPEEIIESQIEDRIIVNAGPGSGKTYSVVKRLGYIVNRELADPSKILVLCYSRSAVSVIKNRINSEINDGNMPIEARQLFDGIRTFDYFVTYMLSDTEIEGTINNLNYDERIERFIKEIRNNKDCFDGFEYIIIDEMQDLVSVRARMVKTILETINCGFLLLGDMCQSIYDYQIKDESELNSYRFYKWLNYEFETDVKRFELTKNIRQKEELAMFSEYMRESILAEDCQKQSAALSFCIDSLKKDNHLGIIRNLSNFNIGSSVAILCRNNAQVSIISTELFGRDIVHRTAKRAQHIDLAPWIAEILSTYTENRIGITAFKERVNSAGFGNAESKWATLKSLAYDDNENVLDVKLLVKSLVSGKEIPSELDLASNDAIIVSTIHRAKGCEYDDVVLISEDYCNNENTLDEIKVAYVSLTRAKDRISFCSLLDEYNHSSGSYLRKYFEKVKRGSNENRNRFYAYMWKRNTKHPFCCNFELGLSGDVITNSFVTETNAKEIQFNLSKMNIGDELEAIFEKGNYWLYNMRNELIGCLSSDVTRDIQSAMEEKNPGYRYYGNYQMPSALRGIYVNNIVTIANTRYSETIAAPYNKSGLWLGVEISGFAKTDWS